MASNTPSFDAAGAAVTTPRKKLPVPWPSRVYYGWAIIGVSFLINMVSSPLNPGTFGFFVEPIADDLDLSLSAVSWAYTIRLVVGGIASPFVGMVVDRIGARWMGAVLGVAGCGSLVGQALVHDTWAWYLLYAMPGIFGIGGPAASLVTLVPASRWFVAKRSRAMAIATVGMPVGGVLSILMAPWLLETVGWRGAWFVYGGMYGAIVIPLSILVVRRSPEDLGMHPDGAAEAHVQAALPRDGRAAAGQEVSWTAKQAVRTPAFWILMAVMTMFGLATSGVLVHRVAFWRSTGLSDVTVSQGIASDPFTVVFSMLIFGFLGDRMRIRTLGLIGGVGMGLSMLPMIFTSGQAWTIFANNISWGIAAGAYITVSNVALPRYFGRQHLGAIRGVSLPITIAAAGAGAPIFGWMLDSGVDSRVIWGLAASLFAGAGLFLMLARRPKLPDSRPRAPMEV